MTTLYPGEYNPSDIYEITNQLGGSIACLPVDEETQRLEWEREFLDGLSRNDEEGWFFDDEDGEP